MLGNRWVTRHRLRNGSRPEANIVWVPDEHNQNRLVGTLQCWADGNNKLGRTFKIGLGFGLPIGQIFADVEPCTYGAWAMAHFDGTGITERDLFWCGEWAIASLRSHPDWGVVDEGMHQAEEDERIRSLKRLKAEVGS